MSQDRLEDVLRQALRASGDGFDYDALIAGTHQRARRIARRRAVVTGVAAAVLVPGVATAAMLGPGLLTDEPGPGSVIGPATASPSPTPAPLPTTSWPETTSDLPFRTTDPPPAPGGTETNPDVPNAWEVPDPRPSGVARLDDLGAPDSDASYPRVAPVLGLMTCTVEAGERGAPPEAARYWSFSEVGGDQVDIVVTGWPDGSTAMQDLRADEMFCAWDGGPQEDPGAGGGDPDRFVRARVPVGSGTRDATVVRTGDYLVAVVVTTDGGDGQDVAGEIADRTAANLAVLDPERGTG